MVEPAPGHPPLTLRVARWLSVLFSALFGLSAALQLNDPDWAPWFVFYVVATAAVLLAPRWDRGWIPVGLLCGVSLVWAGVIGSDGLEPITWDELTGDLRMKTVNVERYREIGGLGISLLLLATVGLLTRLSRAQERANASATASLGQSPESTT
jgi:hypothetical protein